MRFQSYTPAADLAAFVDCLIISESSSLEPYVVLPDTALVLGFQYKGALAVLNDHGAQALSKAGITGLQHSYRTFQNEMETGTVLVRFKPGGAAAFFPQPMHELLEQSLGLDALVPESELRTVSAQLHEATSDRQRLQVVQAFLRHHLRQSPTDSLVDEAVHLIGMAEGNIRIKDLARQLYTSASPLEKRFRSRVGASPKAFAGIVRFRSILNAAKSSSMTHKALEAVFFDQAHFIKDFRRFTGQTPRAFFQRKD